MKQKLQFAKNLRKNQTPAEQQLWKVLRNRQLHGLKFYRQRPIGYYIADFYCPALKLILEVDGAVHFTDEQQAYDTVRNEWFIAQGFTVLRVTNLDVAQNIEGVCHAIVALQNTSSVGCTATLSLKGEGSSINNPSHSSFPAREGSQGRSSLQGEVTP